jgi:glycosyltransferase involved in cell wall biosynthesis
MNRGIETFARECFDGLKGTAGLDLHLFKGAGEEVGDNEHRLWCLPRTRALAGVLAKIINRTPYVVEQLSSFVPLVRAIRRDRPNIVYTSDGNLLRRLHQFRRQIDVPFKLLFSNGGPVGPPFRFADHVQQVAPRYYQEALAAGELSTKHSLVPYGINVPEGDPDRSAEAIRRARLTLELPLDRSIVLSVGWISAGHKRMDYTIDEIAALPEPRPFLVLLGNIDEASPAVINRAKERLGLENFSARSEPYERVPLYYQAANVFVLASLKEGFGRVYLEALIAGLPCVAHDNEVTRFVTAGYATLGDLSMPDAMTRVLSDLIQQTPSESEGAARRNFVRQRFSWPALRSEYRGMFSRCALPTQTT